MIESFLAPAGRTCHGGPWKLERNPAIKPIHRLSTTAVVLACTFSVPSFAQDKSSKSEKIDPNEIVCEKHEVVGSRLAVKRVCLTRAEWAERQRADREEIERVQVRRGLKGE